MTKDNGRYDKTTAERMRRLRGARNEMATSMGFKGYNDFLREMKLAFEQGGLHEWVSNLLTRINETKSLQNRE